VSKSPSFNSLKISFLMHLDLHFWLQVPSQEGRKNPNKAVKEVDEEEEENKMREEAGLTRYMLKLLLPHTVIRFVSTIAKFGMFTVVGLYGILIED
jgi:hypothetical protein